MTAIPDYAQVVYGQHARHVPCWMYVQDAGHGLVSFVGASKDADPHPLRYGSDRTHQLILGEVIVRPHLVVATDALKGYGLAGLVGAEHERVIEHGEHLIDLRSAR